MASSSHKKRRAREQPSSNHGILENWFVGDIEDMTTFMHEISRKKINVQRYWNFLG